MDELRVPQGGYGYNLNFTCEDSDGTAFDLTDYTATLWVWKEGRPDEYLQGACTTDVAASGTCHYSVLTTNFDDVGEYFAKIEATKASTVVPFETFIITVFESI